ncbi:MAG: hypothetical protein ACR2NR_18885 [Solirubrobacteraceae bacterium]
MKRRTLALTVAAFLGISGTAEALSISRFTARATPTMVHYTIRYCDRGGRVHEHFEFFALDMSSGDFTDDAYARVQGGCYIGSGQFPNRYREGLWELKVTMSDSRGALLRRSTRVYLP